MVTATQRQLTDDLRFLPISALAGGVDFDWRFKSRYSPHRLSGSAAASAATPTAIDRIQENSRHYFQRPDAASFALDPARHRR